MKSIVYFVLLLSCALLRTSAFTALQQNRLSVTNISRQTILRKTNLFSQTKLSATSNAAKPMESKTSNLTKRWITGLSLGALCTGWIASGTLPFACGFLVASYIMQSEYNSMVKATGVTTAFRLTIFVSALCYLAAAVSPWLHELILPTYVSVLMVTLLSGNGRSTNISEIATSILGVVYAGYLPSFWVRLRALNEPNFLLADPTRAIWTMGAAVTWWTWTSIVFSDVGAYFGGKNFGRRKLSEVSSAAGSASPNKTVEGALTGFLCCSLLSMLGAYVMRWPAWAASGALYGLVMSVLGLVGDLTASVMKRDAGVKDTGSLLPGHGGLLDRFDSYLLSAPVAYFFVRHVLPWIERVVRVGR